MRQITCSIKREVDVYVTMSRARDLAHAVGFNEVDRTRIEIVILELTRNLVVHAGGGNIRLSHLEDAARGPGLAIEAIDEGPGIPDVELALQDGWSTARTLGAGLPGVRRLMDEFSIDSTVGVGTTVRAVKWLKPPQRRSLYGC